MSRNESEEMFVWRVLSECVLGPRWDGGGNWDTQSGCVLLLKGRVNP